MEIKTNAAIENYINHHKRISIDDLVQFFDMDRETVLKLWRTVFKRKGLSTKIRSVSCSPEFYEQVRELKSRLTHDIK